MQFISISLFRTMGAEAKDKLGIRAKGRKMAGTGNNFVIKESPSPLKGISGYENAAVRLQNEYFGGNSVLITI